MVAAWESANADPTTATGDTSMVVTAPAGIVAGDLLVAFGGCVDARTIAAPAGWTVVGNDTNGSSRVYVWKKVADAADAAADTFTFTASATFSAAVVSVHRVSGASANAPTTAFGTGTNSQTQTAPTLTTPSANCLVFWGAYHTVNQTTATASKGTERIDSGNSTGGCWMAQYTSLEAAAGSVTGAVITTSGFAAKRVYSVAVESAAGGGSIVPLVRHLDRMRRAG